MALVNVTNMVRCLFCRFSSSDMFQVVLDNPTHFQNPFQFEITFECLQELEDGMRDHLLSLTSHHISHRSGMESFVRR